LSADAERVPTKIGTISVEDLEARCAVIEPGIVLLREVPGNTSETYEVMIRRARVLGASFDQYALVVDLAEATERPKGRYMDLIREGFSRPDAPVHLATNQPGSAFLRTVAAFVLARTSRNTSTHPNLDEAIATARERLAAAKGKQRQNHG
jgi:hypothetical protein